MYRDNYGHSYRKFASDVIIRTPVISIEYKHHNTVMQLLSVIRLLSFKFGATTASTTTVKYTLYSTTQINNHISLWQWATKRAYWRLILPHYHVTAARRGDRARRLRMVRLRHDLLRAQGQQSTWLVLLFSMTKIGAESPWTNRLGGTPAWTIHPWGLTMMLSTPATLLCGSRTW